MRLFKLASLYRWLFAATLLQLNITFAGPLPNSTPREDFWVTDGPVLSLLEHDNILYVGGNFTHVGPNTGKGVILTHAGQSADLAWPKIKAAVNAAVADGQGGWYVGGGTYDDNEPDPNSGTTRNLLVHLKADKTLDTAFDLFPSGDVYALLRDGNTLYVAGNISAVGSVNRRYLAAINLTTGQVSDWNPDANFYIHALAISGNTLYVGGAFTEVGGQTRRGLAAIDTTTGNTVSFPEINIAGYVKSLLVVSNTLYVGGQFTTMGDVSRENLAAINLTDGSVITNFNAGTFASAPNTEVSALAFAGNKLYVGGVFYSINDITSPSLAILDPKTGEHQGVDFDVSFGGGPGNVSSLTTLGSNVYVGGYFNRFGSHDRYHLAAIDSLTDEITSWDTHVSLGPVYGPLVQVVAQDGTNLFVGGNYYTIGAVPRYCLAAFDVNTGQATDWNPNPNASVSALAQHDGNIYVGGQFSGLGGQPRDYVGAVDAAGNILPFAPDFVITLRGGVSQLLVDEDSLYIGGGYFMLPGQSHLTRYDLTTGNLTPWNPNVSHEVYALALDGNTLYVGGMFSTIGGQERNRIAAVDTTSGAATSWNPDASNFVLSLAVGENVVYAGGGFTTIGGQPRSNLAALDKTTGLATAWSPDATSSGIRALEYSGSHLLVGGNSLFGLGGKNINYFGVLDANSGQARSLNLQIHPSIIFDIHRGASHYYIGGDQQGSHNVIRPNLSVHRLAPFLYPPERQDNGSYTIFMDLLPAQEYLLQQSTDFQDWFDVGNITSTTASGQLNDPGAIGSSQRFYRIVEPPAP